MSSSAPEASPLGHWLLIYAKGLAHMTATGLSVFAVFCLYIAIRRQVLNSIDIELGITQLSTLLFILYESRNDEPGTPLHRLAQPALWILYLSLCVDLIAPALREYGKFADYWTLAAWIITLCLIFLWSHLNRKIANAALTEMKAKVRQLEATRGDQDHPLNP